MLFLLTVCMLHINFFLLFQVAVVVAILISIIIYKQAVSRSLKIAILDPSVGSITAFVTGAIIQFAFNKLMNYVYYKLAKILTNWGEF